MTLSFVSEIISELRKLNQFLILLVSLVNLEKISFMVPKFKQLLIKIINLIYIA